MSGVKRAYVGEMVVQELEVAIDLGARSVCVPSGRAKVVRDGLILFEGDWIDCCEWASAHKEDA